MKYRIAYEDEAGMERAIAQLKAAISEKHPTAEYNVYEGYEPVGMYLDVCVDMDPDDSFQIRDVVADLLYDIQIEQELPIYLTVSVPPARLAAQLAERAARGDPYVL